MKRLLWIAIVAQFAFCTVGFGQSIADAARKERERQNQTKGQAKNTPVIKNEITGVPATSSATTSATTSSAAAAPAPPPAIKAPEVKDNKGHDEKYWRTAFQKARDDVKRADDRVQLLEMKLKDLNGQLLNRSDIFNKENVLGQQITATQKELDDATKAAAQTKQKLVDLDEELRKSGAPAGWAR